MEEVIEELQEKAQVSSFPLELPTENDLLDVEEQILLSLPYELREFLLSVSYVIYGNLEPVTVSDSRSHTYLPEVTAIAWEQGLPRDLIPICEDRGRYYCISAEGEIGLWCNGQFSEETWSSIWHWVRQVWLES